MKVNFKICTEKGDKKMKSRKITYFKYFSLFFILIALISITGCNGTPPSVPIINSFSALSPTIIIGESSTLSWSVTDATTVTIDQGLGTVALSGTTTVSPITTTTYTLTATNTAGSVTASVTVTVGAASGYYNLLHKHSGKYVCTGDTFNGGNIHIWGPIPAGHEDRYKFELISNP